MSINRCQHPYQTLTKIRRYILCGGLCFWLSINKCLFFLNPSWKCKTNTMIIEGFLFLIMFCFVHCWCVCLAFVFWCFGDVVFCLLFGGCEMWAVVCGLWFVVCGLWSVVSLVCGLWSVVCGLWFVVCGLWSVVCGLSQSLLYTSHSWHTTRYW